MPTSIIKIANSNIKTGTLITGKTEFKNNHAKLINIFTNECPANILANKRIPKLTARATYDTNSIEIINGAIIVGVPVGYSIEKYRTLCNDRPIRIIETIVAILSIKVNEASLVMVSTPGTIPAILDVNIEA
jgi:hypothetical protein